MVCLQLTVKLQISIYFHVRETERTKMSLYNNCHIFFTLLTGFFLYWCNHVFSTSTQNSIKNNLPLIIIKSSKVTLKCHSDFQQYVIFVKEHTAMILYYRLGRGEHIIRLNRTYSCVSKGIYSLQLKVTAMGKGHQMWESIVPYRVQLNLSWNVLIN